MWHLDDYRCTLLRGILRCSFQETLSRNTAENIVKHRSDGVGSVIANHSGGGETSMVVTTLQCTYKLEVKAEVRTRIFVLAKLILSI